MSLGPLARAMPEWPERPSLPVGIFKNPHRVGLFEDRVGSVWSGPVREAFRTCQTCRIERKILISKLSSGLARFLLIYLTDFLKI